MRCAGLLFSVNERGRERERPKSDYFFLFPSCCHLFLFFGFCSCKSSISFRSLCSVYPIPFSAEITCTKRELKTNKELRQIACARATLHGPIIIFMNLMFWMYCECARATFIRRYWPFAKGDFFLQWARVSCRNATATKKKRLKIFNIQIRSSGFVKEHGSLSRAQWATKRYGEWLNALSRRRHSMYYATLARNGRMSLNRGAKVFSTGQEKNAVRRASDATKKLLKIWWDDSDMPKRRRRSPKNGKRNENLLEIIELGCLLASAAHRFDWEALKRLFIRAAVFYLGVKKK